MEKTNIKNFRGGRRPLLALLAAIFFISKIGAQDEQPVESRVLLIFDTSSDMKSRLKSVQTEMDQILAMGLGSQLHWGDSIGVWTFDQNLHAGQFPPMNWNADDAVSIAGEINKFIGKQKYSKFTNFKSLQPSLDQIVQNSPRLTVLIFCDGEAEISGTPYDSGINRVFEQRQADLIKSKQPFVLVLRTQQGRYVGCTVNFPPGMVNLPTFPPWPQPSPPPAPAPLSAPVHPAPAHPVMPIVIIGTHVETNWEAYQFVLTNVPTAKTNEPSAPATNAAPPPQPIAPIAPTNSIAATNAVPARENSQAGRAGIIALAAGLLIGGIALTALFIFRSRRTDSSLITRSMNKK